MWNSATRGPEKAVVLLVVGRKPRRNTPRWLGESTFPEAGDQIILGDRLARLVATFTEINW